MVALTLASTANAVERNVEFGLNAAIPLTFELRTADNQKKISPLTLTGMGSKLAGNTLTAHVYSNATGGAYDFAIEGQPTLIHHDRSVTSTINLAIRVQIQGASQTSQLGAKPVEFTHAQLGFTNAATAGLSPKALIFSVIPSEADVKKARAGEYTGTVTIRTSHSAATL